MKRPDLRRGVEFAAVDRKLIIAQKANIMERTIDLPGRGAIPTLEIITYRQMSFDTAHFAPGLRASARLFSDSQYPLVDGSSRVTGFDEKTIVRWLLLFPPVRAVLFDELRLPPNAVYRPEVVRPFYAPGQGDIDLLLHPPSLPQQTVVLECKRVKVERLNSGQDKINKLNGIAGGVQQANALYTGRFSFFQTYLAIITEVDASLDDGVEILNRGLRSDTVPQGGDTSRTTHRQIVEFPGRDDLLADIGILFVEIVQPSRLSIDTRATLRVCIYRRAARRDQAESVTNRVREITTCQR